MAASRTAISVRTNLDRLRIHAIVPMKKDNITLLEDALACPRCVVSVMGAHAGESAATIFDRKAVDIERVGKTFWLIRSPKARPAQVQEICRKIRAYTFFVEASTKGGARPTTTKDAAREYSCDRVSWHSLPEGLGPVTGKLDGGATALVFDMMTAEVNGTLDLWDYADLSGTHEPLRFRRGCSTVCAIREDTRSHPEKMKAGNRRIVAVARLAKPYCAWIR